MAQEVERQFNLLITKLPSNDSTKFHDGRGRPGRKPKGGQINIKCAL